MNLDHRYSVFESSDVMEKETGCHMGDGTTRVDLLTLEDFRARLDGRLAAAQSVLDTLNGKIGTKKPALGLFQDAVVSGQTYDRQRQQHVQRATRLVSAIRAAQTATDTIIQQYRTVAARNAASQADILRALEAVPVLTAGDDA
jgi:hypothetical protein